MKSLILSLFILISFTGQTQSITEGKVIYTITYLESDIDPQMLSMMPTEAVMYFTNDKTRMEMKMGMGMNLVTLTDNKLKNTTVLMDVMGNKTAMTMTEDDIKKEAKKAGEYEIVKTNETKNIAGYLCKKAIVTLKDKNQFNVWYTDQIKVSNVNWNNQFKNIDGFLMEFKMDQNSGMSMNMTAKSIAAEKAPEQLFIIPEGYKKMTKDEMIKQYQH